MDIKTAKKRVELMLIRDPQLRDDDKRLIAAMWWEDYKGNANSVTLFLTHFANGKLTNPESIRRCRQKLQEENPHLRGKSWAERHNLHEPEVRNQIKMWDEPGFER